MIFFPAIDLKEGQCVRLVRGDMRQATVFNTDPAAQARIFMEAGCEWLHVVDLDGAFTFEFDPATNVFARTTEGLGPLLSERAQTTGKGKLNVAFSYAYVDFDKFEGVAAGSHAYFVHSYRYACADPAHVLATVEYGGAVTAVVGRDNMVGTQFHPEKSQATGLRLITNFLTWRP